MEGTATNLLQEPAVGAVVINYRDVTERRRAEDNLLRQFGQLRALGEIDRAISSTFGMKVSLNTLLTHLTAQLQVDAATVWLVDSSLNRLEFAAARGFRSNEFLHAGTLQVGEGYAGRAALERRPISVPHLMSQTDNPRLIRALQAENFVSYLAMPLLAKGTVRGVLEIFQRAGLDPEPEWLEFLNTLAGQAAIAIENATLFEGMQRANSELTLAYDKTIEGWSAALDLRDKETEGHTQRVTELTLTLAEAFGVNKADLVHVRRGGLLHDIGKMGVPDRILLKPGPLSPDEWEIMRKHPTLAHELLAPISYLERALAIPYCHHEKWDGSGYPRGLKGEQIPLAARLFAVVDVWDALLSDRPYRRAWAREDALEHIRSGSGRHFDPAAVEAFLPLVTQG
jgi:putative nucleotidyltransferase with HDIG domain